MQIDLQYQGMSASEAMRVGQRKARQMVKDAGADWKDAKVNIVLIEGDGSRRGWVKEPGFSALCGWG